jgi:hypothetical protein
MNNEKYRNTNNIENENLLIQRVYNNYINQSSSSSASIIIIITTINMI